VAVELLERGYDVLSIKNPMLVRPPSGNNFTLAVHGLRKPSPWPTHNPNASHYVFIYMPIGMRGMDKIIVLTKDETEATHRAYHARNPGNQNRTRGGFAWSDLAGFPESSWGKLPG
jgi:hypothetical protein